MKFNSQICTSREQSERLLALGLKEETADCYWFYCDIAKEWKCTILSSTQVFKDYPTTVIPAWSLGRLLEILPLRVYESLWIIRGKEFDNILDLNLDFDFGLWYKGSERHHEFFDCIDLYDSAIQAIEWLIKEGYFNKEYLV